MNASRVVILQPPSPPGLNVKRDLAGGFAVANVTSRQGYGHDSSYPTMPHLSLLYLAALLERDGHVVTFVDGAAEQLDEAGVQKRLKDARAEVIVFLVSLPSLYGDCALAKKLRSENPSASFFGVGVVCRALDEEVLERGAFDCVVRGDMEVIVPRLLKNLATASSDLEPGTSRLVEGKVQRSQEIPRLTDLSSLPRPAYHLAPMDRYWYQVFGEGRRYATVQATKGCPYGCYYCPYPYGFGRQLLWRRPEDIVDEVQYLIEKFGCQAIYFRDQVFSLDKERVTRLCEEIIRRGLRFEWVVETRLDCVDGPVLAAMKAAGCRRIHFGLETGDPAAFGRGGGKDGVTGGVEELSARITLAERSGIAAHAFILLGLLGESWSTISSTRALIERVRPTTLQVAIVTPYPGTELFRIADERGLLLTRDWSKYTGFDPVMRTEAMSSDELLHAQAMLVKAHRRAVRWRKARLAIARGARYILDGSLPTRLRLRYGPRLRRVFRGHQQTHHQ